MNTRKIKLALLQYETVWFIEGDVYLVANRVLLNDKCIDFEFIDAFCQIFRINWNIWAITCKFQIRAWNSRKVFCFVMWHNLCQYPFSTFLSLSLAPTSSMFRIVSCVSVRFPTGKLKLLNSSEPKSLSKFSNSSFVQSPLTKTTDVSE